MTATSGGDFLKSTKFVNFFKTINGKLILLLFETYRSWLVLFIIDEGLRRLEQENRPANLQEQRLKNYFNSVDSSCHSCDHVRIYCVQEGSSKAWIEFARCSNTRMDSIGEIELPWMAREHFGVKKQTFEL